MRKRGLALYPLPAVTLTPAQKAELRNVQRKWDEKLQDRWPLAPSHLKHLGLVNDDSYDRERRRFQEFTREFMRREISDFTRARDLYPPERGYWKIIHVGIGEADDLDYLAKAKREGLEVIVADVSEVACSNAKEHFREKRYAINSPDPQVGRRVWQGDIEYLFADDPRLCEIAGQIGIVYVSRVLQFLNLRKLHRTLYNIGELMRRGTRVVIVHAFMEDNLSVHWHSSIPHNKQLILDGLADGAKMPLRILREKTDRVWFEQKYTALSVATQ